MQLVAEVLDRGWLGHIADLGKHLLPINFLLLWLVQQERFRFEIVDGVLLLRPGASADVDNAPGLEVFEAHVGVPKLFLGLLQCLLEGLGLVLGLFIESLHLFE